VPPCLPAAIRAALPPLPGAALGGGHMVARLRAAAAGAVGRLAGALADFLPQVRKTLGFLRLPLHK